MIINYSTINTNRVTIPVKTQKMEGFEMISFNAKHFKSVLNAWNENGYTLLRQTKEMSDGLGGKLTPLGRSTTLYTSLHSTMGLRSKT